MRDMHVINFICVHVCWRNNDEVRYMKWWQIALMLISATAIVGFGWILLAVLYVASPTLQVIMGCKSQFCDKVTNCFSILEVTKI